MSCGGGVREHGVMSCGGGVREHCVMSCGGGMREHGVMSCGGGVREHGVLSCGGGAREHGVMSCGGGMREHGVMSCGGGVREHGVMSCGGGVREHRVMSYEDVKSGRGKQEMGSTPSVQQKAIHIQHRIMCAHALNMLISELDIETCKERHIRRTDRPTQRTRSSPANTSRYRHRMGELKQYKRADVASCTGRNNSPVWIIYKDSVYDVTSYISQHPGGDVLLENAGKDATNPFNDVGHSSDARAILDKFKIGEIVEEEKIYDESGKKKKRVIAAQPETDTRSCLNKCTCGLLG
ncbi:unnamed protein product [Parnassius apollo]|uniref:(apollo) hypothetical protein n=1 Tax=Parnassius apollo TaxID=110799 RepID=A0A8S3YEQ0_PARAO|nr:unnamed protein product [Parnassius apollo]